MQFEKKNIQFLYMKKIFHEGIKWPEIYKLSSKCLFNFRVTIYCRENLSYPIEAQIKSTESYQKSDLEKENKYNLEKDLNEIAVFFNLNECLKLECVDSNPDTLDVLRQKLGTISADDDPIDFDEIILESDLKFYDKNLTKGFGECSLSFAVNLNLCLRFMRFDLEINTGYFLASVF